MGLGLSFAQIGVETPAVKQAIYGFSLLGTLFIDLLKMVLVPLVFTSIAVGVANLRLHSQLHRVWLFTLGFFRVVDGVGNRFGIKRRQPV